MYIFGYFKRKSYYVLGISALCMLIAGNQNFYKQCNFVTVCSEIQSRKIFRTQILFLPSNDLLVKVESLILFIIYIRVFNREIAICL